MTDAHSSRPVAVAAGAVILIAVGVGLGAGYAGVAVLAAAVAAAAAVAVLYRPFLGLLLLVAIIPVENLVATQGVGSPVKLIGVTVFGAWFIGKIARRQSWRPVLAGSFFPSVMLFLAMALVSTVWARNPSVAQRGFLSLALLAALSLLAIDLLDSRAKVSTLIKVLVSSAIVSVSLTVYQYQILGLQRAGQDIAGDVNEMAIMLVTAIPFGFYLVRSSARRFWRIAGLVFIPLAAVGVALTFSRFNLLLIPVTLVVLFGLTLRDRSSRPWMLTLAVAATLAAVVLVPWDEIQKRTETIRPYLTETLQFGSAQSVTSPRGYHLRIGLAIARDHPVLGVGYGNYGYYFIDEYQYQVPGADRLYLTPRSPHSSYVGIAADLGLVGLLLWCAVLFTGALYLNRAWRRSRLASEQALAEALAVGLGVNVFAYAWYSPIQHSKLLWLVLGICVAIARITVDDTEKGQDEHVVP